MSPLRADAQHEPVAYGLEAAKRRPLVDRSHGRRLKADRRLRRLPGSNSRTHDPRPEASHRQHGRPREILTDRGSQFYANEGERREKGISQFEAFLAEQGIRHLLSRDNHPQTNGKLERFYGVYEQKRHQFKSTDECVHWHNEIKPHLSLHIETLETPIQAFHGKLSLQKTENIPTIQDAEKMGNYTSAIQDV